MWWHGLKKRLIKKKQCQAVKSVTTGLTQTEKGFDFFHKLYCFNVLSLVFFFDSGIGGVLVQKYLRSTMQMFELIICISKFYEISNVDLSLEVTVLTDAVCRWYCHLYFILFLLMHFFETSGLDFWKWVRNITESYIVSSCHTDSKLLINYKYNMWHLY